MWIAININSYKRDLDEKGVYYEDSEICLS